MSDSTSQPSIAPLEYASPARAVDEISFDLDGETLHVRIPQVSPTRAITALAFTLAIALVFAIGLIALAVQLWAGSFARVGAMVLITILLALAYAAVSTIQRISRTSKSGRRPIALVFAPRSLTIDSPRDFGDAPRRFELADLHEVHIRVERTMTLALQVTFKVVTQDGGRAHVQFLTRDRGAVRRLIQFVSEFSLTLPGQNFGS